MAKSIRAAETAVNNWYQNEKIAAWGVSSIFAPASTSTPKLQLEDIGWLLEDAPERGAENERRSARERTHMVAGKASKWARRRKIDLAELVDEPWLLLPSNTESHAIVEEALLATDYGNPNRGLRRWVGPRRSAGKERRFLAGALRAVAKRFEQIADKIDIAPPCGAP
jgi:hypothetical protein